MTERLTASDGPQQDAPAGNVTAVLADVRARLDAGDGEGARRLLEQAVAAAGKAGDSGSQAALHGALADLHRQLGELDVALEHYERAADGFRAAGDPAAEADALLSVGDVQRALLRPEQAEPVFEAAAALFESLDDPLGRAHAEYRLGVLAGRERRDLAEQHYQRATGLFTEAEDRQSRTTLRLSNPHLPDRVGDSRLYGAWIMAKVAEREMERLAPPAAPAAAPPPSSPPIDPLLRELGEPEEPVAAPPETSVPELLAGLGPDLGSEEAPEAVPEAAQEAAPEAAPEAAGISPAEMKNAGLLLAALASTFCGLMLLSSRLLGPSLAVGVGLAVAAAMAAFVLGGRLGLHSPHLKRGVPLAVALLVLGLPMPIVRSFRPEQAAPVVVPAAVAPEPVTLSPAEQARADFERQLAQLVAQGDVRGQADLLRRQGELEREQGQRRSLELFERSCALYRSMGAAVPAAEVAALMGDVLIDAGRPEPARQQFVVAVGLYTEGGEATGAMRAMRKRGDAERALQRWDAAAESYAQALALAQRDKDADGEIALILRLGAVEQARGRVDVARPLFEQALRLSDRRSTPVQARVWLARGDFEAALGRDAAALNAYEQAVTLGGATGDARMEARAWRHRSDYERRRGRLDQARAHYQFALRAARRREHTKSEALTLLRLAEVEAARRDPAAARARYAEAQALYERQRHAKGGALVAIGLGDLEAAQAQGEAARASYAQALQLAETNGAVSLQITALDRMQRLLGEREPQAAQDYAQRAAALRADAFGSAPAPAAEAKGGA
ncbi:MAG: tetratricopeptide repeat protein [Candidatus Binatia bacterium]